jgi:hypothetical protein
VLRNLEIISGETHGRTYAFVIAITDVADDTFLSVKKQVRKHYSNVNT